jgi:hypothetical protein
MANEEHLARLKQGVAAWNAWRRENREIRPDLTGADLSEADLTEADLIGPILPTVLKTYLIREADPARALRTYLTGVNLSGADLTKALKTYLTTRVDLTGTDLTRADLTKALLIQADLRGANLDQADLGGADLSKADLTRALLTGASLRGVCLFRANLHEAWLSGADLSEADLTGVFIGATTFGGVDLRTVRGRDTLKHFGPSTIGIDTVYRSHGNLPEVFLRGAGVPDDMITYMKSLVGHPSCFISYSSKDQEFAERLHADLQHKGVRCWYAPKDIRGGRKVHEQIDQAIRRHERLLLILSTYSMQSEWVKTEIAQARQREVLEKRQMLFPVRLVSFEALRDWQCFDADTGKDSAREIREYFIPDFSNWKNHDAYQVVFQRLLRDLKADI